MNERAPKWLLVKLPDGKMVIRCESPSFRCPQDDIYVMPDGTRGMIVQTLDDDADPGYGLLHDLHENEVSTYAEEEPEDALDALGRILRAVIAKTEAAERNKWMEEKATLLEDYNATLKRNVKNLSWCVDVIQKLKAENEKLKGKHRKATALIRAVVEAFCAIGMDVKFVADDGTEVPTTPSKQPNPQSAPPATGEGQCSAESRPEERGRGEVE